MAEEAASAMELERKEAVLQGKPDEALFVLDAAGVIGGEGVGKGRNELRLLMSTEELHTSARWLVWFGCSARSLASSLPFSNLYLPDLLILRSAAAVVWRLMLVRVLLCSFALRVLRERERDLLVSPVSHHPSEPAVVAFKADHCCTVNPLF